MTQINLQTLLETSCSGASNLDSAKVYVDYTYSPDRAMRYFHVCSEPDYASSSSPAYSNPMTRLFPYQPYWRRDPSFEVALRMLILAAFFLGIFKKSIAAISPVVDLRITNNRVVAIRKPWAIDLSVEMDLTPGAVMASNGKAFTPTAKFQTTSHSPRS